MNSKRIKQISKKLPISAIVVVLNEEALIAKCLESIAFCDEVVVVDLGSVDNSAVIASKFADSVLKTEREPYVERVLPKFVNGLRNDWVMHIDPDECLDPSLQDDIENLLSKKETIGIIRVPWKFYYENRPIRTTFWGRNQTKRILYNKNLVEFQPVVHNAALLRGGEERTIANKNGFLHHYWMATRDQLIEKHERYIKAEGQRRYKNGEKYSVARKYLESAFRLLQNLIYYKGVLGGKQGIYLSFFYAWYIWRCHDELRNYIVHQDQ